MIQGLWPMQLCNLASVLRQHRSPQQAARECQRRGWGVRPSRCCWTAGLAKIQADSLERWQAGKHVAQASWLNWRTNVVYFQAFEAAQVTDACLHGDDGQLSGWLTLHPRASTTLQHYKSGLKQAFQKDT